MLTRLITPSNNNSFFLFGARGTGKSTFIEEQFFKKSNSQNLTFNLLKPEVEDRFARAPERLRDEIFAHIKTTGTRPDWIFIDEVQKVPKLLDLVHLLIEKEKLKFILSGSSARKLRRGSANLLGGRAFVNHLFPFTAHELGESFNLDQALQWGSLPKIHEFGDAADRARFLKSYALTYLKEEVQVEQLVRNLDPFRTFLEVAAQNNGKLLNYSKVGGQVGTDHNTIKSYYSILEDTWLGFSLHAFSHSFRKSLKTHPKFYLFDPGVQRVLSDTLDVKLKPQTSLYGEAFEHWVILRGISIQFLHRKRLSDVLSRHPR